MAGHSKWANIKHKKESNDKLRSVSFAKLSRQITLGVIEGGRVTDPEKNMKLRVAIEKAKKMNLPKENIQRAVEKGLGTDTGNLREQIYEVFGPFNTLLIIVSASDNPTRTVNMIKSLLDQYDAKLGTQGSVAHYFSYVTRVGFEKKHMTEQKLYQFAETVEANDIEENEALYVIYIPYEKSAKVFQKLKNEKTHSYDHLFKPKMPLEILEEPQMTLIQRMIDALLALDDVQSVFTNILNL